MVWSLQQAIEVCGSIKEAGRSLRKRSAGQLPDHELQILSRHHAVIVHIKDGKDEAQPVLSAGSFAAGLQRVHKLLHIMGHQAAAHCY